jgi:hypothetical protein
MIVQRSTWKVKVGCYDKFVELVRAEATKNRDPSYKTRIYTGNIGPFDAVAVDFEFEDLAALEKFWTEWSTKPETAEFWKKWNELVEAGGGNEVWNVEEI